MLLLIMQKHLTIYAMKVYVCVFPCGGRDKMIGNKVIKLIYFSMNSRGVMHGRSELLILDTSCMQGVL